MSWDGESYRFLLPDEVLEDVEQEHGEDVVEALQQRVEDREDKLSWVTDSSQLNRAVYKVIGQKGVQFAQVKFYEGSTEFRGIFVDVPRGKCLVLRSVVSKNSERGVRQQHRELQSLRKNAREVLREAEEVVVEELFS